MKISRRFFVQVLIASLVISAVLGIIAIIAGDLGDLGSKVLATTVTVDFLSILGLCCAGVSRTQLHRIAQIIGIASAVILLVLALYLIWNTGLYEELEDSLNRASISFTILAVAAAHACLVLPSAIISSRLSAIVNATVGFITIVAVLLLIWASAPEFNPGDWYIKVLGVALILDVLGTLLVFIFRRIDKTPTPPPQAIS